jgi:extracellular factor (EF) 3-hydroxypalmitic acid methyl ester biosynthesis protein
MYATNITVTQPTSPAAQLFDRVRASIEHGLVNEGLDDLFTGLAQVRSGLDPDRWLAFTRQTRADGTLADHLHQDPLTRRALDKPRGYAGDAVMMDYVYGIHSYHDAWAQTAAFGRTLLTYIQHGPAARAVRNRREHIARLIDEIADRTAHPSILAIAAGHLREVEVSAAVASGGIGKFVALDADAESLREVETRYSGLGVETIHASVRHLLARKIRPGIFDFVYAAGLYDYLNDAAAAALTARLFEITGPGGRVLVPNFAPSCRDRAYMETFMAWELIYRDEYDMSLLLANIPAAQIASYDIYSDPSGSIVYLSIEKAKSA